MSDDQMNTEETVDVAVPYEDVEDLPVEEGPEEVVVKPKPFVKVVEVDNPEYVAYNPELRAMMQKFVVEHCQVPSITYETFHAYINHLVERIYQLQQAKMDKRSLQMRFLVGFVNDKLAGFLMCSMLPQRMPHISTLEVTYIYSDDIHLTAAFMERIAQYKKLWRAKHIACIATTDKVHRALSRTLTGYRLCGYYVYGYNTKHKTISNVADAL